MYTHNQLDEKSQLIGRDPDAGKDWGQGEKGAAEDEMAGWHRRLDGHEFERAPGDDDGQGSLACCIHGVAMSQTQPSEWTINTYVPPGTSLPPHTLPLLFILEQRAELPLRHCVSASPSAPGPGVCQQVPASSPACGIRESVLCTRVSSCPADRLGSSVLLALSLSSVLSRSVSSFFFLHFLPLYNGKFQIHASIQRVICSISVYLSLSFKNY